MKQLRSRKHSYVDIRARSVFTPALVVLVVVIVLSLLLLGIYALATLAANDEAQHYNERAMTFNALSFAERQTIAEWTGDKAIDMTSYTMPLKERESLFLLVRFYGENWVKVLPIYIGVILVFLSLFVVIGYWRAKESQYYFCALPLNRVYGWVLLLSMWVAWPILLLSFVCMCIQNSKFFQAQWQKRLAARKQERAEVRRLAEDELAEIALNLTKPDCSEPAHRALVTYLMRGQNQAYKARAQEVQKKLQNCQADLQAAGKRVQTAQYELGVAQANLSEFERLSRVEASRERAEADWEAIKQMRGVSSIKYNRASRRLEIIIKVRVPYNGDLYDFGDFRLCLNGGSRCNCKEIRSGRRLDYTSTAPCYRVGLRQFCFGSSLGTIEQYLADRRYVEAITLVVECLHSVNSGYDESQIPDCFRKVRTVEKAKRHMQWLNRIRLGR